MLTFLGLSQIPINIGNKILVLILNKSLVSKIQKPASKGKEDLETNMYQEITTNEDKNAEVIRRSKRIKDKMSKIFSHTYQTGYFFIWKTILNQI